MSERCSQCTVELSSDSILYDDHGNIRCASCLMKRQAEQAAGNYSAKLIRLAYSAPSLGIVSLIFNPLDLFSLFAIGNGIYVLRTLRLPGETRLLGDRVEQVKVGAIAGITLGVCTSLIYLVGKVLGRR